MDFSQYVKGNALEISYTTIDISELVSFLQNSAHITKLSLKGAQIGDRGAEALAKLTNLTLLNLDNNSISGTLTAEAILASLEQKRKMEKKLNEESQDRLRKVAEMEAKFKLMGLIQNVANDAQETRASQQQAQAATNDQTTCPDSQLGKVQPISRDQSLSSSRSSSSRT